MSDSNSMDPLISTIATNDLSTLCDRLETQDRALLTSCAQFGTPEIATYLLSRLNSSSTPERTYLKALLPAPSPTHHPILFILQQSARMGNVPLFAALASQHPDFLTTYNRNIESTLVCAMEGGAGIWKVILAHDRRFMDHEFHGHKGCVLEVLVRLARDGGRGMEEEGAESEEARLKARKATRMALLEYLLEEGADTERAGDPILPYLRAEMADPEVLKLVERYSDRNCKSSGEA